MHTSNVTTKGQVTVPADIRRELGIKPGGKVRFVRKGRQVLLEAVEEPSVRTLFGVLKARKGRGIGVDEMGEAVAEAAGEEYKASLRR